MGKNKEENFHGKENEHYYLGNKNLPRGDAQFEWTPEMVRHLKKCKKNRNGRVREVPSIRVREKQKKRVSRFDLKKHRHSF